MKTKATVYLPSIEKTPVRIYEIGKDNVEAIRVGEFAGGLEIIFKDNSWSIYGNMPFEIHCTEVE